jgi:hypothetical protein
MRLRRICNVARQAIPDCHGNAGGLKDSCYFPRRENTANLHKLDLDRVGCTAINDAQCVLGSSHRLIRDDRGIDRGSHSGQALNVPISQRLFECGRPRLFQRPYLGNRRVTAKSDKVQRLTEVNGDPDVITNSGTDRPRRWLRLAPDPPQPAG